MAKVWCCPTCGESEYFMLSETAVIAYIGGFKSVTTTSGEVVPEWDDEIEGEPEIGWDTSIFNNYWCDNCGNDIESPVLVEIPDV